MQSPDKLLADEAPPRDRLLARRSMDARRAARKKVRVKYTLPVDFRLPQTESATVQEALPMVTNHSWSPRRCLRSGGEIKTSRNWIQMHIQYPAEAMKNNIQGRVIVSFIVEKDGSVSLISWYCNRPTNCLPTRPAA